MVVARKVLGAAIAGAFLSFVSAASAGERIGNCEISGAKAAYQLVPARPDQLTVQVHLPAPVWWNGDAPSRIADGFEYCLAANIAYRAGLDRVEVVNVAWPGTAAGVAFWDEMLGGQSQSFDLAMSEISITPERVKQVTFSVPYYQSDIGVMAKAGQKLDLNRLNELRVGVHAGTTGAAFVRGRLALKTPPRQFGDTPSLFMALASGRIDVAMTDTAILLSQAAVSGGRFEVLGQFATDETYGAIYPQGSPNAPVLDRIIQSLIDDGTVARLTETWLTRVWGQDPAKVPYLPVPAVPTAQL
jgi:polar amino acid transport system substrate-binding protein